MNKLLRSPIAAKRRASQAGVLLPGARRAIDARARPHGTGPAPSSPRTLRLYYSGSLLRKRLRIALDPTSLRFFVNNPG